jgi:hypothetical protein
MGKPSMSASGLLGKRLEAMRAGMTTVNPWVAEVSVMLGP